MRRVKSFILSLFLAGCGSPARETTPPRGIYPDLAVAADAVRSRLLRCEGLPAKPDCVIHDALGLAGYYRLGREDAEMDAAVRASIGSDGRPWRSPKHARGEVAGELGSVKSFSRDHILSLAFWSVGARDPEPLARVIGYASRNGWRVCPHDQCILTPAVLDVAGDVLAHLGRARPQGTSWDNGIIEAAAKAEAANASGYAVTLVVDKAFLKALTGNLTQGWREVMATALKRRQENLFFRFVSTYVGSRPADAYVMLATDVETKLKAWAGPGGCNTFSHDCPSTGWELVALADWMEIKDAGFSASVAH